MKFILPFLFVLLFAAVVFGQTEFDKGIGLYQQDKYGEAIGSFQKAVEANENNRDAWLLLGMSFAKAARTEDARKAFEKADSTDYKVYTPEYDKKLKITKKLFPKPTDFARQRGKSGNVKLAVEFGADGKIGFIFPIKTLNDGFTEESLKAARGIKFEPAEKNGKPIPFVIIISYEFSFY